MRFTADKEKFIEIYSQFARESGEDAERAFEIHRQMLPFFFAIYEAGRKGNPFIDFFPWAKEA